MRTRQAFSIVGGVILSLLLITVVFKLYLTAAGEEKAGEMNLLQAAKDGETETVKALLESGADVNAKENKSGLTVLMGAVAGNHIEIVQILLQAGADVNARDWRDETVLTEAKRREYTEIVEILEKAGAKE